MFRTRPMRLRRLISRSVRRGQATNHDGATTVRTSTHSSPRSESRSGPAPRQLKPHRLEAATTLTLTQSAYDTIASTVGAVPAESGAMLGGSRKHGLVTVAHADPSADVTSVTYYPDTVALNTLIREDWNPSGIEFLGFVHSHPGESARPSSGDLVYAERILTAIPRLDRMIMPIVNTVPDTGTFTLNGFVVVRRPGVEPDGHGGSVQLLPATVVIIPDETPHPAPKEHPYLARVADSYDPAVMASTRVVAVGTGGSAGYLEKAARMGVGEFVLIDPDTVEAPNVGTQDVDPLDLGRAKVEALGDKLQRLNPNAQIWTIQAKESELNDHAFHRILREPLPGGPARVPATTLLCAFTDNFWEQDRVQRLGLHFGTPVLSATVYERGTGVEITFAAPTLTRACIRCALFSRYRAYLGESFTNDVTSHGTPFLATDRLNQAKQIVTLAMLHELNPLADADHPATIRYRGWMDAIRDRNLALTRLDPDSSIPAFKRLSQVPGGYAVMDETLWAQPIPDDESSPDGACPDCLGSGDLAEVIGTFADTRVLTEYPGHARRRAAKSPQPARR